MSTFYCSYPVSGTALTIGSPANGLDITANVLSISLASASQTGALSSTDWSTFNNKQNALGFTPENVANKGIANGYAPLDAGNKVPVAYLPNSIMEYLGTWSAATNTPTLVDGTGNAGDVYICSAAGTVNFGSGPITFANGDWVIYSGSIWQKSINSNLVASVNSLTGAVVLTTTNINEGTNLYFTNPRAVSAVLSTVTTGGVFFGNGTNASQNAANFFWDDTNKRLGIGQNGATVSAVIDAHQVGNAVPHFQANDLGASGSGSGGTFQALIDSGSAVTLNGRLGSYQFAGAKDNAHTTQTAAVIAATATENWSSTAAGSKLTFTTITNGTTTRNLVLTLNQDKSATFTGNISALNLSGTNTGDQNLAPYALLTDLTAYALLSGATFTGAISATNFSGSSSGTNTGDQTNITGTAGNITATSNSTLTSLPNLSITESQVTGLVADLALKAPLASPTFTGVPLAPTAAFGTNTTQIATTAFVQAAIAVSVTSKTANYTLTNTDQLVTGSASGGAFTFTLPTAVGITGKQFTLSRSDQTLANIITIATTSSQTIGAYGTSVTLATRDESWVVESDGSNWAVIGHTYNSTPFSFSPTATGLGANGIEAAFAWREGNSLSGRIVYTTGTTTAATFSSSIPTGLTIDSSFLNTAAQDTNDFGLVYNLQAAGVIPAATSGPFALFSDLSVSNTVIYAAAATAGARFSKAIASAIFTTGGRVVLNFKNIPITNWKG